MAYDKQFVNFLDSFSFDKEFNIPTNDDAFVTPYDLSENNNIEIIDEFVTKKMNFNADHLVMMAILAEYQKQNKIDKTTEEIVEKDIIGDLDDIPEHGDLPLNPIKEKKKLDERREDFERFIERYNNKNSYVNARFIRSPILQKTMVTLKEMHKLFRGCDKFYRENEAVIILNNFDKFFSKMFCLCFVKNSNMKNIGKKIRLLYEADDTLKGIMPLLMLGYEMKYISDSKYMALMLNIDEIGAMIGGWLKYLYKILEAMKKGGLKTPSLGDEKYSDVEFSIE